MNYDEALATKQIANTQPHFPVLASMSNNVFVFLVLLKYLLWFVGRLMEDALV